MAAVPCAECDWPVSPSAAQCGNCRAPIRVANPSPPEPPPPAPSRTLVVAVFAVPLALVGTGAFLSSGKSGGITRTVMRTDLGWPAVSPVPDTHGLVGETIRITACRDDWRACADNRDWARNGDRAGPQGACLALAEEASRLGYFARDRSRNAPGFDSYLPGTSIREGYIVLVNRDGLSRGIAGDWVRTPLHCTFDFGAWKVRSLALP